MSKISIEGNQLGSGTFTIASPNSNTSRTLTLPDSTGTVVVTGGAQTIEFAAGTASAPSITTTGDTNTGIYFPAADTIAFTEGGVEAMRIDSSGNVLVGATSVSFGAGTGVVIQRSGTATLRLSDATNSKVSELRADSTGLILSARGAYPIRFDQDDTERMRIDSSGNVGIGTSSPVGRLSVLGADNSTQVVIAGSTGGTARGLRIATTDVSLFNDHVIFDAQTSSGAFRFQTNNTERMRIDSSGNVGIGTNSPSGRLHISNGASTSLFYVTGQSRNALIGQNANGMVVYQEANAAMLFGTNNTERARITSGGDFLVGTTVVASSAVSGVTLGNTGYAYIARSGAAPLFVNRRTNNGDLVIFERDGTPEGSISVSGNTVSYNAFCGGHWTQLQEGRGYNPDIPRGTVMSSIGEMAVWKSVEWTETIEHPAVEAVDAKEAVLDEDGNVIEPAVEAVEGKDAWTESIPHRESYLGNLDIGETFEEDGFTKTVVDDGNERLPKVKISDVVGDKAVYGVFQTWDDVEDMLITSLGAFVVRIAAGVTVEIGDLLESNGDGCAKVQDDDIIRSKTIGKVTSTIPTDTYDDGSYTVPCVIYCG